MPINIIFSFITVNQLEWSASPNQLHLSSDEKQTMPISSGISKTVSNTTSFPLPNDDENSSSIIQESVSVTTSIIQLPNNMTNVENGGDERDDDDSSSHREVIDSYLKNLSILPPLLPLIGPATADTNNESHNSSSKSLPISQQNLPLLQHQHASSSSSSSIINPKQQHQLSKSESAMLNYIYDQYAPNKHKHYDFR